MYGFNLGQIEGLDSSVQTVTLTIANATESNTYTLVSTSGNTWVSNPEVEPVESEIILSTLNGDGVTFIITLKSFTESDVGDAYNVTLSTSAVEENFKSAVETVLADNGLISEPETIFDETLTLIDEELYYELPSDFPDGWYENAVCTVNGVEIPKDPESEYGFMLLTNAISVTVSYIPSDGGRSAALSFSYCDVPNDYAIIPGDYQVKITGVSASGGGSSGLPNVSASDNGSVLGVVNGEWNVDERLKDYPSISNNAGVVLGFGVNKDGDRIAQQIVPIPMNRTSYSSNTFYLPFKGDGGTFPSYVNVELVGAPTGVSNPAYMLQKQSATSWKFAYAAMIPVPVGDNGTYTLKATGSGGNITYTWVLDT